MKCGHFLLYHPMSAQYSLDPAPLNVLVCAWVVQRMVISFSSARLSPQMSTTDSNWVHSPVSMNNLKTLIKSTGNLSTHPYGHSSLTTVNTAVRLAHDWHSEQRKFNSSIRAFDETSDVPAERYTCSIPFCSSVTHTFLHRTSSHRPGWLAADIWIAKSVYFRWVHSALGI